MIRPTLALATLALAVACGSGAEPHGNLLVVCVDTLRADELGAYGAEPSRTPALDALAAQSVVFERAHASASWTLPSVGALFTGHVPSTTCLWTFDSALAEGFPTLAERLRDAGFVTHGIASHVFFDGKYGLQQGFESFDDELCHRKGEPGWRPVTSPLVTQKAERWLEARAAAGDARPWLLFVHYFDPHVDYVDHEATSPGDVRRDERARYRSEIAFTDRHVGKLLAALERSPFARDTTVLFCSDHGESFLEHPPIARHSYGLYEEELRVPLLLRSPGIAPRRVAEPVRTVDLLPTLLELLGVPREGAGTGASLVASLRGGAAPSPEPLVAEIRLKDDFHANALVRGSHKLIEDVSKGRIELYDLAEDPHERHDLAGERPALAAELEAELRARIAAAEELADRFGEGASVPHTPEELEHLRELGYGGKDEPGAEAPEKAPKMAVPKEPTTEPEDAPK